jgi:hypothetical protein
MKRALVAFVEIPMPGYVFHGFGSVNQAMSGQLVPEIESHGTRASARGRSA